MCKTRVCVCVCPSGVCNLCCLCLLAGCDAEGGCDGNLPLFKSTAGTSKPAAAEITEIIRHKRLIYIKMLINLSSLRPIRLRWPYVLFICLCELCVWRLEGIVLWSVMSEESDASLSLSLCQLSLSRPSQQLSRSRPCARTLSDCLNV